MLRTLKRRHAAAVLVLFAGTGALTACGGDDGSGGGGALKLGFFPNITHATALVGVKNGIYAKHLGVKPEVKTFNAGPAAVESLFAKGVDATYVGPNPAINAWAKSKGKAIKIIAGAASGGVALVVRPGIDSLDDLKGKKIATPQKGNTQDVALRHHLKSKGLTTDLSGGGDVKIIPQENSVTLQTFASGQIDGAWVPEPFVSRLVLESKGKVLLDEKTLWPNGQFVITHLVVRKDFADENPDVVRKLLTAHVEATEYINANKTAAAQAANEQLGELTGKKLKPNVLDATFKNVTFTNDPISSSLLEGAKHAQDVGLLEPVDLTGIYDLTTLNQLLSSQGKAQVKAS
ncbi:ABC transporter substrate-binding protein [Thermomonospora umbrina]|uniref:NitT/TauT family transport system substrate-binding protein n=1 Tax=Thermomonospora umbrina TaxID=111806 RepID=A0A3D9ST28_9ACTN|nr:ABC transporter substrate-binding protein [Thermomonospora umbrina]REE96125.1 NitT/TauT family transport system substrate-binding protein [Thermomonospora umbrina]